MPFLQHLHKSGFVQVFGRRQLRSRRALRRPAAEKRQGTKSRRHRKLTVQAISPGRDFRFDGLSCKLKLAYSRARKDNARSDCANRRDA
jgi:hypothetical protein